MHGNASELRLNLAAVPRSPVAATVVGTEGKVCVATTGLPEVLGYCALVTISKTFGSTEHLLFTTTF